MSHDSDPKAAARALKQIRRPVAARIRLACVLSALGALAGLAPFVGSVELADALLATPVDRDRVVLVAVLIVVGLLLRAGFMSTALTITHLADVRLQAILRRRMIAHLGRVPLGWFARNSSGRLRKTAMGDVDACTNWECRSHRCPRRWSGRDWSSSRTSPSAISLRCRSCATSRSPRRRGR